MQKWEYYAGEADRREGQSLTEWLNEGGNEGWELVAAVSEPKARTGMIVFLKRPKA